VPSGLEDSGVFARASRWLGSSPSEIENVFS
jgi:hypothetical protein